MLPRQLLLAAFISFSSTVDAFAQIELSGTPYTQNFNQLAGGLPTGWTVSTAATASGLGTTANADFVTTSVSWASANGSGLFRNTSSNNIASNSDAADQHANPDRALGWRPNLLAERNGAITVAFADTLGFSGFSVSLTVFTFRDVAEPATYAFEYRVGTSGAFTQLGASYATGEPFSTVNYSFSGSVLDIVANQAQPVYFRLRGTTSTGTGSLDGVAIDNFALGYSAIAAPIPEPAQFATIIGAASLASLIACRRRRSTIGDSR